MTESELEDESITPEVIEPSLQLMKITKEANLEPDLANEFRINFEEHFKMANEWSKKAKAIIVTNDNQTVLMEQARVARLFIRAKRLEIENFRKVKKEYYLRGGQAVDKVATFLKNMIEPIERHLDLQEYYVEYKKKAEEERIKLEIEARIEQERLNKEKADIEERYRLKEENDKLIKEREEKERANKEELERVHKENEKSLQVEREKLRKSEEEIRARKQEELKKEADKVRAEEGLKSAGDEEKILAFRNEIGILLSKMPEIKSLKYTRLMADIQSHLHIAFISIKITQQEE